MKRWIGITLALALGGSSCAHMVGRVVTQVKSDGSDGVIVEHCTIFKTPWSADYTTENCQTDQFKIHSH